MRGGHNASDIIYIEKEFIDWEGAFIGSALVHISGVLWEALPRFEKQLIDSFEELGLPQRGLLFACLKCM